MTLRIRVIAPSLPAGAAEIFASDVRLCFDVYRRLRRSRFLPASRITAVLADDFPGEVERNLRGPYRVEDGGVFVTARVGGEVGAKNLDQAGDASDILIVFNADFWHDLDDPVYRLHALEMVAHELAHPVIERARYSSGLMDSVILPSITGSEVARSMARILTGEYRADGLADRITSASASVTVDGSEQPAHAWTVMSGTWLDTLRSVVDAAYPAWPDLVQSYREYEIDLAQMWGRLATLIDQTLTIIVHAQATADAAGVGRDLLEDEPIASLPATRLYLADPLRDFIAVLRAQPLLPHLRDVRDLDGEATVVGASGVIEIWRRLGLTIEENPEREWALWVGEPLR